jgi:hypothetical protein
MCGGLYQLFVNNGRIFGFYGAVFSYHVIDVAFRTAIAKIMMAPEQCHLFYPRIGRLLVKLNTTTYILINNNSLFYIKK